MVRSAPDRVSSICDELQGLTPFELGGELMEIIGAAAAQIVLLVGPRPVAATLYALADKVATEQGAHT